MIESYLFDSGVKGPHLLVLGAIHGDEPCGTYACKRLIEELEQGLYKLNKGLVTFIPVCNPKAFEANTRFVEKNLNRVFKRTLNPKCYEEKLANAIAPFVDDCDYLLDLHSFTAEGDPFVFQDYDGERYESFAKALGVRDIMTGWVEMYEKEGSLNEGDTVSYAHSQGKVGVLVECGQNGHVSSNAVAYKAAHSAMAYLGIVQGVDVEVVENQKSVRMTQLICKNKEGVMLKPFNHMDFVPKGEKVIQYQDGETFETSEDLYILMPKMVAELGEEWFYLGKKEKTA